MENLNGKIIYTRAAEMCQVIGETHVKGELYYIVNQHYPEPAAEHNIGCLLISKKDMEELIENIEINKKRYVDSVAKQLEYEEERLRKEEQEAAEKARTENLYGFADNKTAMQKGKILKTLLVRLFYRKTDADGKQHITSETRKDFIIKSLKSGCTLQHKENIKVCSRNGNTRNIPHSYRLLNTDGTFFDITKTEYEFGKYLIDNDIKVD